MNKFLTTLVMATIAFSPLVAMKAASLTELSQNYRPNLPSVDTNIDTNAEIDTTIDLNGGDGASEERPDSNTGDNARMNSNQNASVTGSVMSVTREDLDVDANVEAAASFRARQSENGRANVDSEGNASASVGAENAALNANERAFEVASENSILLRTDSVATEEDLRAFSLAAMEEDSNLNGLSFGSEDITVEYRAQGRFIGLLPVFMDVDVNLDEEGDVEFDYPWYSFLVVKDTDDLEERIEAGIEAHLSTQVNGWTNSDRAELAAIIASELRAHYESQTSAASTEETE